MPSPPVSARLPLSPATGAYSVTAALSGAKLGDYTVTAVNGTLTVAPAPLLVSVASTSKLASAANPAFSVSYQGFVLGQTASVLGGNLTFSTTASAASGVGGYVVTASGLSASNYAISFVSGGLIVTPAPLLVVPGNEGRLYGAANPVLTGTITGLENGDPITATYTTSAAATSAVGVYPINAALNDPMNLLGNYTVTITAGTLTITPAPLVVTPGSFARPYGAANPALTGTISGLENNDPISAVYTASAGAGSNTGSYPIVVTLNDPGYWLRNYTVTTTAGTLTINAAPLVVTPGSFARLYGAANPTFTGTLSGVENGDAITASFSTPADASSAAGPYSITAAACRCRSLRLQRHGQPGDPDRHPGAAGGDRRQCVESLRHRQSHLRCRLPGLRPWPVGQRAGGQSDLQHAGHGRQRRWRLCGLGQRSDLEQLCHHLRQRHAERDPGAAGGHARRREPPLRRGQPDPDRDDHRSGEQRRDHRGVYNVSHCLQRTIGGYPDQRDAARTDPTKRLGNYNGDDQHARTLTINAARWW